MTTATWQNELRAPNPCDHIVQIYDDEAFLVRTVTHFIGTGFAGGEAAVVIATPPHAAAFTDVLRSSFDVDGMIARRQLTLLDAETCLGRFMVDGKPNREKFLALVHGTLAGIRAAGYPDTRLYGEMVNLLWRRDLDATMQLEELWNEVLGETGLCLLCAYTIDNFDRHVHRGLLHQITRSHSHLIPAEDYSRLEAAVDRAYRDVFGVGGDAATLREILARRTTVKTVMPAAQAALFAARELNGDIADSILERARHYYRAPQPPSRRS